MIYFIIASTVFFIYGKIFLNLLTILGINRDINKKSIFVCYYPFLGIFFIGFLQILINFFFPLGKQYIVFVLIFFFLINLIKFKNFFLNKKDRKFLFFFLIISLLVYPYAYSLSAGYDAGFYHFTNILWLRETKIIFGFANLNHVLGYASIQEYLANLFITKDNIFYLRFSNLIFYSSFLYFIFCQIIRNNFWYIFSGLTILLYAFLHILGFRNFFIFTQFYGYVDVNASIVFLITFISFLNFTIFKKYFVEHFTLLIVLTFFSWSFKPQYVLTFFLLFVYLFFFLLENKNFVNKKFIRSFIFLGIIFLILLTKNFIISGCLFYPIKFTCINTTWTAFSGADSSNAWVTAWARDYTQGLKSLDGLSWIFIWFKEHDGLLFFYSLSIIFSCIFFYFLFFRGNQKKNNINILKYSFFYLINILLIVIWFIRFPTIRFGQGFFLSFFFINCLFLPFIFKYNFSKKIKYFAISIFCIVLLKITTFDKRVIKLKNFEKYIYAEVIKRPGAFGTRPITGDLCWMITDCYPGVDIEINTLGSYSLMKKL